MLRKKWYGRALIVVLAVMLVFLCFAGCADENKAAAFEEMAQIKDIVSFLNESGYDIAVCLDESDSINRDGIKTRNHSAKSLVHMLSEDCRLAIGFFSKEVNEEEGLVSVAVDGVQEQLLGILDRNVRKGDGTNLNLALEWALNVHENDSTNQKVVIIFTDGTNYVSTTDDGHGVMDEKETQKVNDLLRETVARAATADNGNPIPVYVVYIEQSVTKTEKSKLCDLFDADDIQAEDLDTAALMSGKTNKVITAKSMDDLGEVFMGIFSSLKNIGYKSFESTERGLISLSIPEIGATRVRIYAESDKPFVLSEITSVVNGKAKPVYASYKAADLSPEVVIIEPDEGEGRIKAGDWQIKFESKAQVQGVYSITTDFDCEVTFTQQGQDIIRYGQPASAEVRLIDGDGEMLRGGKKTSVSLVVDREYPMKYDDGVYRAEGISFPESGASCSYFVQVKYDEVLFSCRSNIQVMSVPDEVEMDAATVNDVSKDGFFVLGSLKEYTSELDENKPVKINVPELVNSAKDKQLAAGPKVENGLVMLPDFGRDFFTAEIRYTNVHDEAKLTRLRVDTTGQTPQERMKENMIDSIVLFAVILAAIALMFIVPFLAHRKAEKTLSSTPGSKQLYDVRIERTHSGEGALDKVGYLNAMNSSTMGFNPAIRDLNEMRFPMIGGVRKGDEGDVPLSDSGFRLLLDNTFPNPVLYVDGQLPVFEFFGKRLTLKPGSAAALCYHKLVDFFKMVFSSTNANRQRPYAFKYTIRTESGFCKTKEVRQFCVPLELSMGYSYIIEPEYINDEEREGVRYCISGRKTEFYAWENE